MASGLNGQNFSFNGYLPIETAERKKAIKRFEKISRENNQSQLFIETPYRNDSLFEEFIKTLSKNTWLCIATDLTLPTEFIATKIAGNWIAGSIELHKRPTIFIIQA
jgi:16S rRNA (cytidine1402-2'-O)-methyltransferase